MKNAKIFERQCLRKTQAYPRRYGEAFQKHWRQKDWHYSPRSIANSGFKKIDTWGDEITVFDALAFLFACIFAYTALKTKDRKRRLVLEKIADFIFLTGLTLMVIICILIVYNLV